jgi:hypothetical protein
MLSSLNPDSIIWRLAISRICRACSIEITVSNEVKKPTTLVKEFEQATERGPTKKHKTLKKSVTNYDDRIRITASSRDVVYMFLEHPKTMTHPNNKAFSLSRLSSLELAYLRNPSSGLAMPQLTYLEPWILCYSC